MLIQTKFIDLSVAARARCSVQFVLNTLRARLCLQTDQQLNQLRLIQSNRRSL